MVKVLTMFILSQKPERISVVDPSQQETVQMSQVNVVSLSICVCVCVLGPAFALGILQRSKMMEREMDRKIRQKKNGAKKRKKKCKMVQKCVISR